MDSKYNIENFERFLREKSDEFRIYPSKRVWYSIYNNMHPGNRLPSISMSIILIFSLLLVGYLNTDTSNQWNNNRDNSILPEIRLIKSPGDVPTPWKKYFSGSNQRQSSNQQIAFVDKHNPDKTSITIPSSGKPGNTIKNNNSIYSTSQKSTAYYKSNNQIALREYNNSITGTTVAKGSAVTEVPIATITSALPEINNLETPETFAPVNIYTKQEETSLKTSFTGTNNSTTFVLENKGAEKQNSISNNPGANKIYLPAIERFKENGREIVDAIANTNKNNSKNNLHKVSALSETDKAWIDNFAMYNKPIPKKWAGKVSWQAYITPSVVYRKLDNNAAGKLLNNNAANFNNTAVANAVNHKPSLGLETGLALQYDVLKRVKVKAGVQLNYARYNAHAFENYHPIATSLEMNSDNSEAVYEVYRTTPFSNGTGLSPVKLHNESYQISLPIGLDFKLATFDNLEWYVGATIQPSMVVYGRSFVISTDRHYYVQDPSILNRFNLNAGFETYVSFKTNSYTWQFGPQLRSQIFTTNSKLYSVEERLQNYGFKIGISKKL